MLEAVQVIGSAAEAEYAALRTGAVAIDRSHRARWRLAGPKGAETLTGLVTNDVMALAPGQGQYAAMLTPKGKIIADVTIYRTADALIIDVPLRAAAGFAETVKKYVNPRVTPYADETAITSDVGAYGVRAAAIVAQAVGLTTDALTALPPYGHLAVATGGIDGIVVRVPTLGLDGFSVLSAVDGRDALWQRLLAAGAVAGGSAVWDVARVEAGRPEWGVDIDETTIPQEAGFDELGAISYTKGCYTGQETVARIHFRGHVNRHLRGLRMSGEAHPLATTLVDHAGKPVGDVRSTVRSPRLGPIALAMVRREIDVGATILAGDTPVTVTSLPFPAA
jgi:tRNA-modifying protein YgfZ